MNKATFHSLTAAEQSLLRDTDKPRLLEYDEDALIALLDRVRKQRSKSLTQYRRGAAARIQAKGARGKQRVGGPPRDALKAEMWEAALARVSARLATLARTSAAEIKAARLEAARADSRTGSPTPAKGRTTGASSTRARTSQPIEKKNAASVKASGKRRQAARDAK